ncbi:hemerythrin-like metal-binding protein [Delftia acidovorans SPH-1]|jgi:hemerythrin|uniref:Hemerythrin-like metal-binding protein n=6 Tax=Pseudomonadati TaxID=3379134 RepID=A9BX01_DELAS|nr:hemerythrin-like metal-binding protein [Delftia acidovorans SPH-1]AEF89486.1 hemerythrin-like metal-binding protein [Delftia sp. Cs1-4]EZP48026.1 Hemerythrin-like metal-binding protein [Delftia sp. RIT313]MCA1069208.1 Bacteriohemerythrin [Delftia acidovorans]TQL80707.1 hemerythrin [Delftia sp. HK171]
MPGTACNGQRRISLMQISLICIKELCDSPVNTSLEITEFLENVMALLVWVPELDTGIAEIDRQHRRIVDYINKLYELRSSPDREALGDVIGEMIDYTVSHFVFEESLIESAGYMFAGPHKKVHELFTRRVIEMQTRFDAGEDVAAELHGMLSRWLFNHIRNEDTGYVDSAKAYLRMARESSPAAEKERLKNEVLQELELQRKKKGWLARLLNR